MQIQYFARFFQIFFAICQSNFHLSPKDGAQVFEIKKLVIYYTTIILLLFCFARRFIIDNCNYVITTPHMPAYVSAEV